ncbi:MAG: 2-hydroxyacyl-CoA dehydratase [Acidobacteria bacterium]|jgi:hypothetical protein|nr:2-hydroxyacyl-CoA dehydratase [Acidobacteriota bacterium]
MRIGYIPPIPAEIFAASPHEAQNLWSHFALATNREEWLATARMAGLSDSAPFWARSLYAIAIENELEEVWYPDPGVPQEVRAALSLLQGQGIRIRPFHFPILRNIERLQGALDDLCRDLDVDQRALKSSLEQWSHVRVALRRFDALQYKNGAFPSLAYTRTLAKAMNPGKDIEGHRRELERQILEFEGSRQGRWTKIGFIGLTPYRSGLYKLLDEMNAIVVYDEWGLENNPQGPARDLVSHYHQSSLPYGLKRRQERILKEIAERRLRGLILGVECLCHNIREQGFFRSTLPLPVFTFDNCSGDGLRPTEEANLRRFMLDCSSCS